MTAPSAWAAPFAMAALVALGTTVLSAADKDGPPFTPGQVFQFSPTTPKYVTATCEFRDPADVHWPSIFSGRASEGSFTADAQAPTAAFTVVCPTLAQAGGDRARRVLGELADGQLTVSVRVLSLGARIPGDGKRKAPVHAARIELTANGRTVALDGLAELDYEARPAALVQLTLRFTLSGKDLGLSAKPGPLSVEVHATGLAQGQAAPKK
jgi:hypothetical protein